MRLMVLALLAMPTLSGCGSDRRASPDPPPREDSQVASIPIESIESESPTEPPSGDQANSTQTSEQSTSSRVDIMEEAQRLASRGEFESALTRLRGLVVADPEDAEAIFMMANVEAARGQLDEAVELLESIPADHPDAGLPALGQSADWLMQLQRFDEAEQRYRSILDRIPDMAMAHRQLAFLLNRQGRRQEAAEHVRELCKLGNVTQDELQSLIVLSHAMYDDPNAPPSDGQQVRYTPIGAAGKARKLFTDGEFEQAAEVLQPLIESGQSKPATTALYGRIVVEAQDDRQFTWWLTQTNQQTKQFADYWAALGTWLISQRRFEEATRALLEAANRDPTDMNSFGRLGQTLLTLGDREASDRWLKRWEAINELVKTNNRVSASFPPDPDAINELAGQLESLDRQIEATMWRSLEAHYRGTLQQELPELNARRLQLVRSGQGFANQEKRLCDTDLEAYALPKIEAPSESMPQQSLAQSAPIPARMVNVADKVGLEHAYQVAAKPQREGFAIYQTYGGAVVVLDYDLDGQPDLYFSQGGSDPPVFEGEQTNQLLRGVSSEIDTVLVDVTARSQSGDPRYTLGATAGDWNQDGFPDLVLANLGEDRLLINNGDGTFTAQTIRGENDQYRVPSSVAMADVTGDAIPDILEVAYVDDPKMIYLPRRNENGEVLNAMGPTQYLPGADRICIGDGAGGMSVEVFTTDPDHVRMGLGIFVTDVLPNAPGNEIFVGNDLYPDQLWVRSSDGASWMDVGPAVGAAFGIRGSKTASMGIAAADLDDSGTIDIHITNYQDRNSSLFMNLGEAFLERNVQFGMATASQAVLGFGTQAIDYDNDGDRDLVVTNGHIEDALSIDAPFEQPLQMFANLRGRFELTDVEDSSGYWDRGHVGRGLARLDFNRDGKPDFAVTHLGEQSALVLNETDVDHRWIQFQLIGTKSERDAIGSKVQITFADQTSTDWVIAGDGYLSKNESTLMFGLGGASEIESVTIDWPSGTTEEFGPLASGKRWLVIEGLDEVFELGMVGKN